MVSAPVKSAPVNDPKKVGVPGARVRMMAPKKSGTIIIPPGTRSIVRLMGSCMGGLRAMALEQTADPAAKSPQRPELGRDNSMTPVLSVASLPSVEPRMLRYRADRRTLAYLALT